MLQIFFVEFAFVLSTLFLVTGVHSQDCGQEGTYHLKRPIELRRHYAEEVQWPWIATITIRKRSGVYTPWCTGFLIDRRHVISAAHCFHRRRTGLYSTCIGSVYLKRDEEYPISNIVVPEEYKTGMFYDDIAILTLTRDVDFPDFNPICLPDAEVAERNLVGTGTTVAGWGEDREYDPLRIVFQEQREIPVVSNQYCNKTFRERVPGFKQQFPMGISAGILCAGFAEGEEVICAGNPGGPLMLKDRDRWFDVGVGSYGISCGEPGIPRGFTRVSTYLRWIKENTRY